MLSLTELFDRKHKEERRVFKYRKRGGTRRMDTPRTVVEEGLDWGYIPRAALAIWIGERRLAKDRYLATRVHRS